MGERERAREREHKMHFELRRERGSGSPLSAMLLSSFNAFVAYCDLTAVHLSDCRDSHNMCAFMCMCSRVCVCVCVCLSEREHI